MLEDFLNWFDQTEAYFCFFEVKKEFTFDTELNKNASVSLILNNKDIFGKIILSINGECELFASWNGYTNELYSSKKNIFNNKEDMEKVLLDFIKLINHAQMLAWYCRDFEDNN